MNKLFVPAASGSLYDMHEHIHRHGTHNRRADMKEKDKKKKKKRNPCRIILP